MEGRKDRKEKIHKGKRKFKKLRKKHKEKRKEEEEKLRKLKREAEVWKYINKKRERKSNRK